MARSSRLITDSDIDSEDDLPTFSSSNFVQPSLVSLIIVCLSECFLSLTSLFNLQVDGDFDDFLSSLVDFSSVVPSKKNDPFSELVYDSDTTEGLFFIFS